MKYCLFILLSLVGLSTLVAQQFFLRNPSFEGQPADATVPVGWLPCQPGTTPDILPGFWGVYQEANEGDTYVGLITRHDGTWESIAQRLPRTLSTYECFTFTLDLAHSRTYMGYNRPIRLRIWGGRTKCLKEQLLFESEEIRHTDWRSYVVEFTLERPVNYLLLEAYYPEHPTGYPGNILIDNISVFQRCPRAEAESIFTSDKVY